MRTSATPTEESAQPAMPRPRGWKPLALRWCWRCELFTECGLCPRCLDRLPPEGEAFAHNVFRGELDVVPLAETAKARGACAHCSLVAPFHRNADCPGIRLKVPPAPAGPWVRLVPAPAAALPASPAHRQEAT